MKGGELQGVLVGLRTAVDEEQAIVLIAAGVPQPFGQLALEFVDHGIAVEAQLSHLAAHGLHVVGMCVTDGDDGVAAIEVEVLRSLFVPNATAFATRDGHIHQRINIE